MSTGTAWRILHHDIAAPPPELGRSPGDAGLTLVLWAHGVPLGRLDWLAAELPVPAAALAALIPAAIAPAVGDRVFGQGFEGPWPMHAGRETAPPDIAAILAHPDPLGALRAALALPAPPAPGGGLSVVICTRDRPDHLARCLASLGPNLPFIEEVIVVDNGTRPEPTQALVAATPKARCVAEPRPGLSIARNAGLRAARQEIVAFTDDDVEVHRDWAARLLAAFAAPGTACVTGLVLPTELATEAQLAFERGLGGFGQGMRRITYDRAFFEAGLARGVPVWRIGAGANMAIRRGALERAGGFDERLGAGAAGCSEDSELWYRLLAGGGTCRYEPAAVVFHEHRRDWPALKRQMHAYMRGHVAALFVQYARHGHAGNLRRLALTIPADYLRVLASAALRRDRHGRARLLGAELTGVLAGLGEIRMAFDRRRPASHPGEGRPEEASP